MHRFGYSSAFGRTSRWATHAPAVPTALAPWACIHPIPQPLPRGRGEGVGGWGGCMPKAPGLSVRQERVLPNGWFAQRLNCTQTGANLTEPPLHGIIAYLTGRLMSSCDGGYEVNSRGSAQGAGLRQVRSLENDKAYMAAQEASPAARAWFHGAHADGCRPQGSEGQATQGPQAADGLMQVA